MELAHRNRSITNPHLGDTATLVTSVTLSSALARRRSPFFSCGPTFYTFEMSYLCPTLTDDDEAKDGPGGGLTPRGLAGTCSEVPTWRSLPAGRIAPPP